LIAVTVLEIEFAAVPATLKTYVREVDGFLPVCLISTLASLSDLAKFLGGARLRNLFS
jgi:hypothetical protein